VAAVEGNALDGGNVFLGESFVHPPPGLHRILRPFRAGDLDGDQNPQVLRQVEWLQGSEHTILEDRLYNPVQGCSLLGDVGGGSRPDAHGTSTIAHA